MLSIQFRDGVFDVFLFLPGKVNSTQGVGVGVRIQGSTTNGLADFSQLIQVANILFKLIRGQKRVVSFLFNQLYQQLLLVINDIVVALQPVQIVLKTFFCGLAALCIEKLQCRQVEVFFRAVIGLNQYAVDMSG